LAGDQSAFAVLYDRHAATVFGVCRAVLRDDGLAEEAAHDVLLGLWQRPDAYQPERGSFVGWIGRVARNRAIDLLRRQREHPFGRPGDDHARELDALAEIQDPEPPPLERALLASEQERVRAAVRQLTADQQRLIQLAYWGGLSQREIGLELERPLGTVKTQIRVAMKRLLELLAEPQTATEASHVVEVATERDAAAVISYRSSTGVEAPER
jgi:RNA polymerase sigma-70 factor (ECF subfamily)